MPNSASVNERSNTASVGKTNSAIIKTAVGAQSNQAADLSRRSNCAKREPEAVLRGMACDIPLRKTVRGHTPAIDFEHQHLLAGCRGVQDG